MTQSLQAWGIALTFALLLALALGFSQRKDSKPYRIAEIGTALSITPEPTATQVAPLTLDFEAPPMTPDQAYWYRQAQIVSLRPAVTSNTRAMWLSLLWTETNYRPWAESEAGCYGLGQLCGSLRTPETDADPIANLNASLDEFLRLIETHDGSYNAAIGSYKGVTTEDQRWQADTVFQLIKVSGG